MISTALASRILRAEFTDGPVWLALHAGDPDDGAPELAVGRQWAVFAEPVGRSVRLAERPVWDPMPAVTVTHWSAWDAATGGGLKWTGRFDEPVVVRAGEGFRMPPERTVLYFDVDTPA